MSEENELIEIIAGIDDADELGRFFEEIFTPAELEKLIKRWKLIKMIDGGIAQREIAAELGISLCKITRGSKILKDKKSVTRKILARMQRATR